MLEGALEPHWCISSVADLPIHVMCSFDSLAPSSTTLDPLVNGVSQKLSFLSLILLGMILNYV